MGSTSSVVIRQGNKLVASYLGRGDELHKPLAFGPKPFFAAFQSHFEETAKPHSLVVEDGILTHVPEYKYFTKMRKNPPAFAQVIGDDAFVYVDVDDRVLWYKTSYIYDGDFWQTWFASWLAFTWPGWRVFRSTYEYNGDRDLLEVLGVEDWDPTSDPNRDFTGEFIAEPPRGAFTRSEVSYTDLSLYRHTPFLIRRNGQLRLCTLYGGYERDVLVRGLDEVIKGALPHSVEYREPYETGDGWGLDTLIDFDNSTIWTTETGDWPQRCAARDWPGWSVFRDAQGVSMWLKRLGHDEYLHKATKTWVRNSVRALTYFDAKDIVSTAASVGVGPDLPGQAPYLEELFMDLASIDDPLTRGYYADCIKPEDLKELYHAICACMVDTYWSRPDIQDIIWTDRSHPEIVPPSQCPYSWEPDVVRLLWEGHEIVPSDNAPQA